MNRTRGTTKGDFSSPLVVYTWDTDALDTPKVNRQNCLK
jgi:hypothetical protein